MMSTHEGSSSNNEGRKTMPGNSHLDNLRLRGTGEGARAEGLNKVLSPFLSSMTLISQSQAAANTDKQRCLDKLVHYASCGWHGFCDFMRFLCLKLSRCLVINVFLLMKGRVSLHSENPAISKQNCGPCTYSVCSHQVLPASL